MAKKKTTKKTAVGCKRVSRKAAQRKVKGRTVLKKGCRYLKGDGAQCCPTGGGSRGKGKGKKAATGRSKKRKVTGAAKRARRGQAPSTPMMARLNEWRRIWASATTCPESKKALQAIRQQMRHMDSKPATPKRGETAEAARARRMKRWNSEYMNKLRITDGVCLGLSRKQMEGLGRGPSGARGRGRGLSGTGKKKHPCATANPPAWCGR